MAADAGWSIGFGDYEADQNRAIAIDDAGNTYFATSFVGTIDVAPGQQYGDNRDLLSSNGNRFAMGFGKLDASGAVQWTRTAQQVSGSSFNSFPVTDLELTAEGVYFAGLNIGSVVDFDVSGSHADSRIGQRALGGYVGRLDAATGELSWVREFGDDGSVGDLATAVDSAGAVYLAFENLPNQTTYFEEEAIPSTAAYQGVLTKLDDTGNRVGAFQLITSDQQFALNDLDIDDAGEQGDWQLIGAGTFYSDLFRNGEVMIEVPSNADGSRQLFTQSWTSDLVGIWSNNQTGGGYVSAEAGSIYTSGIIGQRDSHDFGNGLPLSINQQATYFLTSVDGNGATQEATLLGVRSANQTTRPFDVKAIENVEHGVLVAGIFPENTTLIDSTLTASGSSNIALLEVSNTLDSASLIHSSSATNSLGISDIAESTTGAIAFTGTFQGTFTTATGEQLSSTNERTDVYLTLLARTDDPVGSADNYETPNGTPLVVPAPGVLANDRDPQGDPLQAVLLQDVTFGNLSFESDGGFTYLPEDGFVGSVTFQYQATNGTDASAPTDVVIEVLANEVVVFEDSFEAGSSSNDWNGNWVEDSQNDWFRSSQRATQGSRSAEVDGYANNATLTMANSVDLMEYDSATLSFDWLIESSFDSGEYIAADIWNGSAWTEVARRSGNQDAENTWANNTIELDASMMSSDFEVRFRAKVSRSNEDANIDNVSIVGIHSAPPADNVAPVADAGSGYVSNEGGSLQLDASASTDADGTISAYAWDLDGDGSFDDATGVSVTLPTPDSGDLTVSVQVTDDQGATDTASTTVTVNNLAPTAVAGGPYVVDVSQSITVDASASFDPGNDLTGYAWDLDGDGDYEQSGITADFTASTPGDYTIGLRVTDADGASSQTQTTVTVEEVTVSSGPNLSHGEIESVGSSWQTITLPHSYESMVVIATPRYNDGSGPGVVRLRNTQGNAFEVSVASVGASPFSGGAHYVVVEEGVYDETGFKLEAVKRESTITDGKNSWPGQSVSYQQPYDSPVVVGQVMTSNDADWSVFYATGASRTSAPDANDLKIGKHVGEDPDTTRASETIGYLVIESTQNGTVEGLPFVAGVGGDTVRGVGNGTYEYSYTAMPNSKTAILSSAGMDGGDGGWAVLMGNDPITPTGSTIDLAIDEDQLRDTEHSHTTEQVAYFVIDPPLEDPMDVNGDAQVTAADALRVINHLARLNRPSSTIADDLEALDVNQDGKLSALDALVLINRLQRQTRAINAIAPAEAVDAIFATPNEEEDDPAVDQLITDIL